MDPRPIQKKEAWRNKKILIIDDDRRLVRSLERWLRSNGYECLSVTAPEAAMREIKKQQPNLVLLDLDMPKISGLGLLRKIKQDPSLKNSRVVVLTGISDKNVAATALDVGASAYLVKTYILQDLVPILTEYA